MDIWASSRYSSEGLGGLTNDASTVALGTLGGATGTQRNWRTSATLTDTAAHDAAGGQWTDAYGEALIYGGGFTGGTNSRVGIWLRVADSSNCYTVVFNGLGTLTISKVVTGTPTSLGTASYTIGDESDYIVMRAEARGDNLSAFWRGQHILTVADTTYQVPGFVSFNLRSGTNGIPQVIRWEAGPIRPNYVVATTSMAGPFRTGRSIR